MLQFFSLVIEGSPELLMICEILCVGFVKLLLLFEDSIIEMVYFMVQVFFGITLGVFWMLRVARGESGRDVLTGVKVLVVELLQGVVALVD